MLPGRLSRLAFSVLLCCANCCGQTAQTDFANGQAALAKGDLTAAATDFRAVLEKEPRSVAARANLGVVYMRRREWPQALDQFALARRLAPGNPGIEINIGLAYFHEQNYAAAIPAFRTVLESNPASLQARYLVALCDFATENYGDAVANLTHLWDSENSKMAYLYVLALSALKTSDQTLEQKALARMFDIGQNTAEYHLFVGRTWLQREHDEEALKELREAERLNPALPFVHYTLGTVFLNARDYARAKAEFAADAVIEPDLALDQEQLGDVAAKLLQPREAEEHYRQAVKLDRRSARAYLGLAKIEKAEGRYRDALADLNEACQVDDTSASAHYLRAQVLVQLNRATEGKAEFAASARLRQSTRDKLEEEFRSRSGVDAEMGLPQ